MENMYTDGTYLKNVPNWHQEEANWKASKVVDVIKRNNLHPSSICEVGCGSGEVLRILSEELAGDKIYDGYDISPQAIEICSNKARENLRFYLKDLTETKEAKYDIVLALDVVEHIEDYYGFLRKLRHKGKYKIFHIPLAYCVKGVLCMSQIIDDRKRYGHIHCFSKDTALSTLEDVGYKILEYTYIGKRVERSNLGWQSNLLKIPRKLLFTMNQDFAVKILGGYSISILAE